MFGYFYHETLAKVTKAFGSLFNGIYVSRMASGKETERILVPINLAHRHAYIARPEIQPDLEHKVYTETVFPRMAYEMVGLQYEAARKLNTIHRRSTDSSIASEKKANWQSVPYSVDFLLTIVGKHMTDANQILEQILPYYTPALTVQINALPEMGYLENIPVELTGIQFSDNYQEQLDEVDRVIKYELNFIAHCQFYGPVTGSKIIKSVQVDISSPVDFTPTNMDKAPLLERGTWATNPPDAEPGDEFTVTETWYDPTSPVKYNPSTGNDDPI
jgi:hypothetical protein